MADDTTKPTVQEADVAALIKRVRRQHWHKSHWRNDQCTEMCGCGGPWPCDVLSLASALERAQAERNAEEERADRYAHERDEAVSAESFAASSLGERLKEAKAELADIRVRLQGHPDSVLHGEHGLAAATMREREAARVWTKQLCAEWCEATGATCDAGCDSYGHAVHCKATNIATYVHSLRSQLERAQADTARLEWMLTETANVLKGEPPPDTQHLWHDLPDRAREAAADAARLRWLDLMAVQCDEDAIGQAFYDLSSVQLNDRMRGAWATSLRAAIDAAMSRASSAT